MPTFPDKYKFYISDVTGKNITLAKILSVNQDKSILDLSDLSTGIYLLQWISDTHSGSKKFSILK
jgi:hypothetical protein